MNAAEALREAEELRRAGRFGEARQICQRLLSVAPTDPDALHLLALIALQEGAPLVSIPLAERAIAERRGNAQFHFTLAIALRATGDFQGALSHLRQALRLKPVERLIHSELGITLHATGRTAEARASFQRALALEPDNPDARFQMGLALLCAGDFERGWAGYEFRPARRDLHQRGLFAACPEWRGEDLAGKTLLLHAEQGFGDTIQFARYVPLLAARGARLTVAAPEELLPLLSNLPGVAGVMAEGALPAADCCCALGSLPFLFGTLERTIPANIPYLAAPPERTARWRGRLQGGRGLRVGMVWAGRPTHVNDRNRSLPAAEMAPLAAVAGIALYSLQKGAAAGHALPDGLSVERLRDELADFADTAAVLQELDVVVSVDTSVAHLAGALGRPTLLLLPAGPDWRWLTARQDSPWYPTLKLVRQPTADDWGSVMQRVATELADRAAAKIGVA